MNSPAETEGWSLKKLYRGARTWCRGCGVREVRRRYGRKERGHERREN
nr:MAG TPA: hypothetical protein [Bacteriophage sp.]